MAKHTLFLMHGMGVHKKDEWAEPVINQIRDLSKQFHYFNRHNIDDIVEFVPLNYDHILSEILEKWSQDAGEIDESIRAHNLTEDDVTGWLKDASNREDNFVWTHVADVIIYRFFKIYRERIRIDIVKQLGTKIDTLLSVQGQAQCSILAHSLGTAVVHDAVHYLGTVAWGDFVNMFAPGHWWFQHIFMLANTSRLLQSSPKAYESIVRPISMQSHDYYFNNYCNIRHEYDPVTFVKPFDPVGWGVRYKQVTIRHFYDWNIHDFTHYLLNPRVHIPLFKKLAGGLTITPEEEASAVDTFDQFGGKFAAVEEARDSLVKLDSIRTRLGEDASFGDLIKELQVFFKTLQEIKKVIENHP